MDEMLPVAPLDQPPPSAPAADAEEGPESRSQAGYTGSESRCLTCNYFDDQQGTCKKHGFEVEEGGHCASWEPPEGAAEEGAPSDFDDDMEPFEEEG